MQYCFLFARHIIAQNSEVIDLIMEHCEECRALDPDPIMSVVQTGIISQNEIYLIICFCLLCYDKICSVVHDSYRVFRKKCVFPKVF